jgi:hypothetical protein
MAQAEGAGARQRQFPITKRVYNLGLDEFFAWFSQEARPGGFTKTAVAAWRGALKARGLGAVSDHGGAQAGSGGRRRDSLPTSR